MSSIFDDFYQDDFVNDLFALEDVTETFVSAIFRTHEVKQIVVKIVVILNFVLLLCRRVRRWFGFWKIIVGC